jgi:hypothetical protein
MDLRERKLQDYEENYIMIRSFAICRTSSSSNGPNIRAINKRNRTRRTHVGMRN